MKQGWRKFTYYIGILFLAIAVLVALPDFRVNVGENYEVNWRGLSSIGISENLFDYLPGRDLFAYEQVEVSVSENIDLSPEDYSNAYQRDKRIITQKLQTINTVLKTELSAREYIDGTKTFVFELPGYINSAEQLVSDLVVPGRTEIVVPSVDPVETPTADKEVDDRTILEIYFPDYEAVRAQFTATDAATEPAVSISNLTGGPVVEVEFDNDVRTDLYRAFNQAEYDPNTGNPIKPVIASVDGLPIFWAIHPDIYETVSAGDPEKFPTTVTWVPLASTDTSNVAIQSVVVFGDALELSYELSDSTTVASNLASDGVTFALAMLLAAIAFVYLTVTVRMRDNRKRLIYTSIVLGYLAAGVFLTKFFSVQIDANSVFVGVAFSCWVLVNTSKLASTETEPEFDGLRIAGNWQSVLIVLLSLIMLQFPVLKLIDALQVILLLGIAKMFSENFYSYAGQFIAKPYARK